MSDLKGRIQEDTVKAMRARAKERLAALRLINAEIKQIEVDQRTSIDDKGVVEILVKMLKQRRDSLQHYEKAGRDDLARTELLEIEIITEFMPSQLSSDQIETLVLEAIVISEAKGMKDMGKVMDHLKNQLSAGSVDMGLVSTLVKQKLSEDRSVSYTHLTLPTPPYV